MEYSMKSLPQIGKLVVLFGVAIAIFSEGTSIAAAQATESVLYSFAGNTADGAQPFAGLALDPATGNLYGATYSGGLYGQGVVFELQSGATTDNVLCNLPGGDAPGGLNGAGPWGTPVFFGGKVYGTAEYNNDSGGYVTGDGVVYECAPNGGGGYTYSVLHQFTGASGDGANPNGGVTIDSIGSYLYGTTVKGGSSNDGTIFKEPITGGTTSPTIYSFTGGTSDGSQPYGGYSGMAPDTSGNLVGATSGGGTLFAGIAYAAITSGTIIYRQNFGATSNYGFIARSDVFADASGNHYGTTMLGGSVATNGLVYDLFALGGGRYQYSVPHVFAGGSSDGANPWSAPLRDSSGNLYGTTMSGGTSGYGVVYELTPSGSTYSETILWNFAGGTSDGANPYSNLVIDASGTHLYGTTANGGANGHGTIFEITLPPALAHKHKS